MSVVSVASFGRRGAAGDGTRAETGDRQRDTVLVDRDIVAADPEIGPLVGRRRRLDQPKIEDRGRAGLEADIGRGAAFERQRSRAAGPTHRLAAVGAGADAHVPRSGGDVPGRHRRSEEHTSELQSLMRISYAVFCLKKKTKIKNKQ